jgi:hypothetical protein
MLWNLHAELCNSLNSFIVGVFSFMHGVFLSLKLQKVSQCSIFFAAQSH